MSFTYASADVLCVKNKVAVVSGRVNFKNNIKRVSGTTCPARHTQLLDLTNLVGETGNLPNAAAGKTFTGTFSTGGTSAAIGDWSSDTINFPTKLSSNPTPHIIEVGGAATIECPGTYIDPQAIAGHLCIYVGDSSNVTGHSIWSPTTHTSAQASVYGAAIYAYADSINQFYSWGTWALTTN